MCSYLQSLILSIITNRASWKPPWSSLSMCKGGITSIIVSSVSVWSLSNEPGNSCSHMLFWIIDALGRCFYHSSSHRLCLRPDWIGWSDKRRKKGGLAQSMLQGGSMWINTRFLRNWMNWYWSGGGYDVWIEPVSTAKQLFLVYSVWIVWNKKSR